jgi:drug/metabolite transporter (DMT)-like permease
MPMPPLAPALWTRQTIVEMLGVGGLVLAILFGLTLVVVGGRYFVRMVAASLGGYSGSPGRERAEGEEQAGRLAMLTFICGPIVSLAIGLAVLPIVFVERGMSLLEILGAIILFLLVGVVAGLIGGGAFLVTSLLLGPVRKQVGKWRRGNDWDPDFDSLV